MTPYASSLHTHSTLCDGKSTLAEMAAAAFAAGVKFFGATGHSLTPEGTDTDSALPADLSGYFAELHRLRAEYEGRMEVLTGIEWDSVSAGERPAGLDYWIGSVHYLVDGDTGRYLALDWKPEYLAACRDGVFRGDMAALVDAYYEAVAAMAESGPDILGHIDLITKFNSGGAFFDEADPRYKKAALAALHAAHPEKTLLEINTGAISRGYRETPYPALFLLKEWRVLGGELIITSDSHSADTVVFGYAGAIELARAAGYDRAFTLTRQGRQELPFDP